MIYEKMPVHLGHEHEEGDKVAVFLALGFKGLCKTADLTVDHTKA